MERVAKGRTSNGDSKDRKLVLRNNLRSGGTKLKIACVDWLRRHRRLRSHTADNCRGPVDHAVTRVKPVLHREHFH